uniref:Uncharacterized protein n=1 Tax=Arundo donax TaxID=35708 RepID=A0A0A9HHZ4_ARUDO
MLLKDKIKRQQLLKVRVSRSLSTKYSIGHISHLSESLSLAELGLFGRAPDPRNP